MGMDCIPRNPKAEGFHASWTGWTQIERVLRKAGVDLSEMSGTNDGEEVTSATAKEWAEGIRETVEDLKEVRIPDESYLSGEIGVLVDPDAPIVLQVLDFYHSELLAEEVVGGTGEAAEKLEELAKELQDAELENVDGRMKEFLLDFADFCERSNGFEQW